MFFLFPISEKVKYFTAIEQGKNPNSEIYYLVTQSPKESYRSFIAQYT